VGQLGMGRGDTVLFDGANPAGQPCEASRYRALYPKKVVSFQSVEGPWEDSIDGC